MMVLQGKVALVTGAGQGVGQGIALALAAEGARVAVTGRTLQKLQATCELIQQRGGEALPVVCDVKSLASPGAMPGDRAGALRWPADSSE
jgi:meso-butanediol dehydrogenase/(S,S)-butanediol dehydrogenase/diacetyl reductase